jgi:hypothetical protein
MPKFLRFLLTQILFAPARLGISFQQSSRNSMIAYIDARGIDLTHYRMTASKPTSHLSIVNVLANPVYPLKESA